jgi:Flp pilus assembly protein TadB
MGIAWDPLNILLFGSLFLVLVALAVDEYERYLVPTVKRWQAQLMPAWAPRRVFLPLIVALMLAVLMRAPMASLYLVLVGIAITWYYLRRARRARESLPSRQILQLVLAFRGTFQLQPSVFSTLDMISDKVDEPLRSLVKVTVETFYLTSSPQRAYAEMRARTDNVYINQFAYILEMSETASVDAVVDALDNLVDRLRTHDDLRRQTEASLTSITGQTAFIQAIAVLVVFAVAMVPTLRAPYVSTGGQLFFIAIVTVMLVASYYIDSVVSNLAERIS